MTVKLLEFPVVPLTDIPARLRLLAEQIEDGEFGDVASINVAVEADGVVTPLGFGESWDESRAMGLFMRAANRIGNAMDAIE
jgi:hypothetical protein